MQKYEMFQKNSFRSKRRESASQMQLKTPKQWKWGKFIEQWPDFTSLHWELTGAKDS